MKGKPILWQAKRQADIFSPHFREQLRLEDMDLPKKEQPFYYDLKIQVPLPAASNSDDIKNYAFNEASARRLVQPEHIFENILSERADEILNMFCSFGYAIVNVEICAEPMEKTNEVVLIITEGKAKEYDKKGNLKSQITVVSIIPNGPGFRANLVQTLVDLAIQMKKDQLKKEKEPPKPPAEVISVSRIFEAVSKELASEDGVLDNLQVILKSLGDNHFVSSKQPLNISGNRNAFKPKSQNEDYVPTPEWLVYIEKLNYSWSLKEMDSVKATQLELEHAWQRKTTQFAFAFHRLKPINYILAAKTSNGNVIVTKQDTQAKRYSTLQIIWTDSIS